MSDVDLEARLRRLEVAVESKVNVDKLQKELDALAKDPTVRLCFEALDYYDECLF